MATFNYNDASRFQSKSSASTKGFKKVGYFTSLKDDGDSAIIRLDYGTQDDFEVVTVHSVKVKIKDKELFRSISCLKTSSYDADDVCPFCASGNKAKFKVYLRMVEYVKDESGKVVPTATVWERPSMFVRDVIAAAKDGIDDGFYKAGTAIRDMVFKVARNGKKGDKGTTYRIKAVNPAVYTAEAYPADFSGFENFDVTHHSYSIKSAEDILTYLDTGNFPAPAPKEDAAPATAEAPAPAPAETSTPATKAPADDFDTTTKPKRIYSF